MSIRVMTAVFEHSKSRLADRLVLLVIADRSDHDGSGCFRGKDSIARLAHVSRTTVTTSIARLEDLGELQVTRRAGRTSEYQIVLPGVGQNPAGSEEGGRPESGRVPGQNPAGGRQAGLPRSVPDPSTDTSKRRDAAVAAIAGMRETLSVTERADAVTREWWESMTPRPNPTGGFVGARRIIQSFLEKGWTDAELLAVLPECGGNPVKWKLEALLREVRKPRGPKRTVFDRWAEDDNRKANGG